MLKIDNKCLVCEGKSLKNFITGYNKFWPRYFKRVAICKRCGHIQLNPLYEPEEYKLINSNFFSITPKEGLLVLFPSYLHHSVDMNKAEEERIVISFNIDLIY